MELLLIHGRDDPDKNMEDWGYHGQTLEDVAYVHWTYGTLTVGFVSKKAAAAAHALTGWPYLDDVALEMHQHESLIQTTNMVGSGAAYSYFGDFELVGDSDPISTQALLSALEMQEMAEADPAAGRRKGYFDKARAMRKAALERVRNNL